jgi:hypothetical protein
MYNIFQSCRFKKSQGFTYGGRVEYAFFEPAKLSVKPVG